MRHMRRLGNKIKQYAIVRGVTTAEIALELGCSTLGVEKIYTGMVFLSFDDLKKVANIIGVKASSLLSETDGDKKLYTRTIIGNQNNFSNVDNLDKILDILEDYISIKEAIALESNRVI